MEIKKSPQADLERGKGLSLLLGLVVAISVLFVTLEWRSLAQSDVKTNEFDAIAMEDVMIVQDEQQEEQPEEVQQPEQQIEAQLPDDFKVVEDNKEVAKISFVSPDEDKPLPPPTTVGPAVEPEDTEEIFTIVEEPTEFPGGPAALVKFLTSNVKYPEIAMENGIQGRVMVKFVVERDGSVSNVDILRGVDPALDKEAVRVVKSMPKWKPGKQRGKPVRQSFQVPVVFRLQT